MRSNTCMSWAMTVASCFCDKYSSDCSQPRWFSCLRLRTFSSSRFVQCFLPIPHWLRFCSFANPTHPRREIATMGQGGKPCDGDGAAVAAVSDCLQVSRRRPHTADRSPTDQRHRLKCSRDVYRSPAKGIRRQFSTGCTPPAKLECLGVLKHEHRSIYRHA